MADNKLAPPSKNKLPWYEQALPMEGRAAFLPFQDTMPGSVMNQRSFALPGIIAGAVNAATAPGRAYSGSDPNFNSEEEAANFAMNVMGGGMGASRAAPAPAGSLGMNVYHGTPHRFRPTKNNPLGEFDASKIGTGEGAQAYGHGLYFAEKPEVARAYQNTLSKYGELRLNDGSKVNVPDLPYNSPEQIAGQLWMNKPNLADAKFALSNMDSKYLGAPKEAIVSELEKLHGKGASLSGSFFKVDLPDEHIAKMLDWDKPLSQQGAVVQALLQKAHQIRAQQTGGAFKPLDMNQLGKDVIPTLGEQRLQQAGIPGIRYLDGGSRSGGQGTSNFVVFPGNEGILKIIDRK